MKLFFGGREHWQTTMEGREGGSGDETIKKVITFERTSTKKP